MIKIIPVGGGCQYRKMGEIAGIGVSVGADENRRPAWLAHAHAALDGAVAAAYGWPGNLSDDEILERLLALNEERAAGEGKAGAGQSGRRRRGAP